jgi:hypothetical protein
MLEEASMPVACAFVLPPWQCVLKRKALTVHTGNTDRKHTDTDSRKCYKTRRGCAFDIVDWHVLVSGHHALLWS